MRSLLTLIIVANATFANWNHNHLDKESGTKKSPLLNHSQTGMEVNLVTAIDGTQQKRYLEYSSESLVKRDAIGDALFTCSLGYYRVEGATEPPCPVHEQSVEDSLSAGVFCCNCNQGEQWEGWKWTYVQNAKQSACVENIYVSGKGWIAARILAGVVLGLMAFGICLPLFVTCNDSGPKFGCCVRGRFLFGCRDKTGCWWRTDSRSLIMLAFFPFYVCEALAMMKFVSWVDLNIHPSYDEYSFALGVAMLSLTTLSIICLPLAWFCLGVNGQMRGRRHIVRREKNGFTISLFHSWHLHTYFYYCSLVAEVGMIVIAAVWLLSVPLGDPDIRNGAGNSISRIAISPSRSELFYLIETVFWIHVISFLHIVIGIRIYNDQYFKSKFGGVKLLRRGACFFVDYCVEEPLIKSLDCDYKKFVMDADGTMRCAKETFAKDEDDDMPTTQAHSVSERRSTASTVASSNSTIHEAKSMILNSTK